jgi:putative transposase
MNTLYMSLGISKQAFYQYKDRQRTDMDERNQLLVLIAQVRKDHPTMGVRDMYYKLCPTCMGRDAFEAFCKQEGLSSQKAKNLRRTTDSTGVKRFENKLEGLEIIRKDQVWQSDITYVEVKGRFYYLTFIIDAFTRMIVGHSVSDSLLTIHTTVPALKKAIAFRDREKDSGQKLIFHSDGGGQYYANKFLDLTRNFNITNSMCEYAWENGKAERINGVIKNNYLRHKTITCFDSLKKEVDRSVYLYNYEKPHIKLQRKTPFEFETKQHQRTPNSINLINANLEHLQFSSRVYKRLRSLPPLTKTVLVQ